MPNSAGSLCSGYGGLDLAVEHAYGARTAWVCELDPHASVVLAERFPVPNLGDLTAVDWSNVEPVDILTAGFPCQPVSTAGRRAGTDDERWLFDAILDAIGRMDPRPRLLVFENVPGLLSANDGHALARVVHGLAAIGYVGRYGLLPASAVGAPHRRLRWFCVARDADRMVGEAGRSLEGRPRAVGEPRAVERTVGPDRAPDGVTLADQHHGIAREAGLVGVTDEATGPLVEDERRVGGHGLTVDSLVGTDGQGEGVLGHADHLEQPASDVKYLPTPEASDGTGSRRSKEFGGTRPSGAKRSIPLATALHHAPPLPTPAAAEVGGSIEDYHDRLRELGREPTFTPLNLLDDFGPYAAAVARWEPIIGRPAPDPLHAGRLNPVFVEWMMGLPEGWVTDLDLSRSQMLRILGNGVVPLQAAAALCALIPLSQEPPK